MDYGGLLLIISPMLDRLSETFNKTWDSGAKLIVQHRLASCVFPGHELRNHRNFGHQWKCRCQGAANELATFPRIFLIQFWGTRTLNTYPATPLNREICRCVPLGSVFDVHVGVELGSIYVCRELQTPVSWYFSDFTSLWLTKHKAYARSFL